MARAFKRVRAGELLALLGAVCVVVSLFEPAYESPSGTLNPWGTFGPAVVLEMLAAAAALVLALGTLAERTTALPVSAGVWTVLFGLLGVIGALVRVLERPGHATSLCGGTWLALAGAALVLLGAWLSIRDERGSLYAPATPAPRRRPEP